MGRRAHDILGTSSAWRRLQDEIPQEVNDPHVRRILHDYAQVVTILVGELDGALNEVEDLHGRVDQGHEAHMRLKDDLFHPKTGHFAEMKRYIDERFGKFTAPMFVLVGSVVSGLILLAANRITEGG